MRILITGSRKWTSSPQVEAALLTAAAPDRRRGSATVTVVHGGARGADMLAGRAACRFGWAVEEHRAAWWSDCTVFCPPGHRRQLGGRWYCPLAGHYRNQAMVDLGADVCLAFPVGASRGTRDCMRRAALAGIPVRVVEAS